MSRAYCLLVEVGGRAELGNLETAFKCRVDEK